VPETVRIAVNEAMLRRAIEYMPGLAELSAIRVWTGFRAATPDKLPLIGPCPDASAPLLADGVLGRKPAIAAEAYLLRA
jgi:glycine/D-amino acid oxidase-like deaminating enzyme